MPNRVVLGASLQAVDLHNRQTGSLSFSNDPIVRILVPSDSFDDDGTWRACVNTIFVETPSTSFTAAASRASGWRSHERPFVTRKMIICGQMAYEEKSFSRRQNKATVAQKG